MSVQQSGLYLYGYKPISSTSGSAKGTTGATGTTAAAETGTDTTLATDTLETASKCTDGKDDGKISFWEKLKSGVTGVLKTVAGAVCAVVPGASEVAKTLGWKDAPNFSLKAAAMTVGAIALSVVCPPAGLALCAVGVVQGGKQIIENAAAAYKIEHSGGTDAEIKAAYENIGSGAFTVAMSVVGAKASLKACGNTRAALEGASLKSPLQSAKAIGKAMWQDSKISLRQNTQFGKNILDENGNIKGNTPWEKAKTLTREAKDAATRTAKSATKKVVDAAKNAKNGISNFIDECTANGTMKTLKTRIDRYRNIDKDAVQTKATKAMDELDNSATKMGADDLAQDIRNARGDAAKIKELRTKIKSNETLTNAEKSALLRQTKAALKTAEEAAKFTGENASKGRFTRGIRTKAGEMISEKVTQLRQNVADTMEGNYRTAKEQYIRAHEGTSGYTNYDTIISDIDANINRANHESIKAFRSEDFDFGDGYTYENGAAVRAGEISYENASNLTNLRNTMENPLKQINGAIKTTQAIKNGTASVNATRWFDVKTLIPGYEVDKENNGIDIYS